MRQKESRNVQMIFELVNGKPIPRLPRDDSGKPRMPNGRKFFSLAQAARRSGRSAAELRDYYYAAFQELLPDGDLRDVAASAVRMVDEISKSAKPASLAPLDPSNFHAGLIDLEPDYDAKDGEPISIWQTVDGKRLRKICVLVPENCMRGDTAIQLAQCFSLAPSMWRLLREDTARYFNDLGNGVHDEEKIRDRLEVLSSAVGKRPFNPPEPQCDDQEYVQRMEGKPRSKG